MRKAAAQNVDCPLRLRNMQINTRGVEMNLVARQRSVHALFNSLVDELLHLEGGCVILGQVSGQRFPLA